MVVNKKESNNTNNRLAQKSYMLDWCITWEERITQMTDSNDRFMILDGKLDIAAKFSRDSVD